MTDFLIILFGVVLIAIMAAQLRRKAGHYEFPFLAAAVFGGFILLQAIGLRNDAGLPEGALNKVMLMSILCVTACFVGFRWGERRRHFPDWRYDEVKFLQASYVFVVVGAVFFVLLSRLPVNETQVSQWSGRPVAYLFFARCFSYGLIMALMLFLGAHRKLALIPIIIGVFLYVNMAIIDVRRTEAVAFFLMILLAAWYARQWRVPKAIFLLCVVVGILGVYSVSELRSLVMGDKQFSSMLEGDFMAANRGEKTLSPLENTRDVLQHGGPEVRNAAYLMAGVEESFAFDFGICDWNAFVFTWVPAQIVGRETKEALMIPVNSPMATKSSAGYEAPTGTTICGIADAFGSFWYFGFIKFLFIGWVLGVLNSAAVRGNWTAAILSMALITDGMVAITHSTNMFLTGLLRAAVFLLPALWCAKFGKAGPVSVHPESFAGAATRSRPFRPRPRFPGAMARLRS